ncbi:hypothetical protein KIPB_015960, partial [Kipferlia bialata]
LPQGKVTLELVVGAARLALPSAHQCTATISVPDACLTHLDIAFQDSCNASASQGPIHTPTVVEQIDPEGSCQSPCAKVDQYPVVEGDTAATPEGHDDIDAAMVGFQTSTCRLPSEHVEAPKSERDMESAHSVLASLATMDTTDTGVTTTLQQLGIYAPAAKGLARVGVLLSEFLAQHDPSLLSHTDVAPLLSKFTPLHDEYTQ